MGKMSSTKSWKNSAPAFSRLTLAVGLPVRTTSLSASHFGTSCVLVCRINPPRKPGLPVTRNAALSAVRLNRPPASLVRSFETGEGVHHGAQAAHRSARPGGHLLDGLGPCVQ